MMLSFLKRVTQLLMLLIVMSVFGVGKVRAQSITPAQDGTGTNVTTNGNRHDIDGGSLSGDGANLFHSFEQFGLSEGEIANFSSNPNLVNILGRIRGGDPSMINGLIQVTGGDSHLFLMNPAGFVFGDSAALNVPGNFTVTTANGIQFGSGWFNATGANDYQGLVGNPTGFGFTMAQPGAIVNEGNLAVGAGRDLSLVGGAVVNTGELEAPGGGVVVSAVPGENLVRLSIPGNVLSLEVEPLGESQPNGWNLPITALPDLLTVGASGVQGNSDGTVQVAGVQVPGDAGTAIVSGEVDVSGEMGGNVGVFAEKVAVVGAEIDASGVKGGGKVWIGGDYKGEGTVPNAQRTLVDGSSVINADAGVNGDGGEVIVWADEATGFDGSISARGGSDSGNGGFAEVSGRNFLDFQGNVDTQAPKGQSGSLLLDPTNINVVSGAGNTSDTTIFFGDPPTDAQVSASSISNATSNVILQATNDISFQAPINITTPDVGLTAEANNNIRVLSSITTNGGNFTLKGDSDNSGEGLITTFSGTSISTGGGNIRITGSSGDNQEGILLDSSINSGSGTIALTGTSKGTGEFSRGITIGPNGNLISNGGMIVLTGTGNEGTGIILFGLIDSGGGNISVTGTTSGVNTDPNENIRPRGISINSAATFISNGGNIIFNGSNSNGPGISTFSLINSEGGNITFTGTSTGTDEFGRGLSINSDILSEGGDITFTGTGNNGLGIFIDNNTLNSGGGEIRFTGTSTGMGQFSTGIGPNPGGNILSEGGNITFIGIGRDEPGIELQSSLNSGGGNINLTGSNANSDPLTFSAGSTVEVNANITTAGGDINITSGGIIDTTGGTLNSGSSGNGGAINLTAPNGNINTGDLFSFSQLSGNTTAGNGGGITLNAGGDINSDVLNSSSTRVIGDGNTGNGGTISLEAGGNIQVTEVDTRSQIIASSQVTNRTAGNGGDITLEAGNDITVIDRLLSFSRIGITDGDGTAGNGGAISLTAGGNINIPGADFGGTSQPIYSESRVSGNGTAGNGGAITLTAEGGITINGVPGDILGANAIRAGSVVGGDGIASNGGAIKFETQSGDINIDVLEGAIESAAVVVGEGTAGDGGTITFDSGGNINVANPVISGTGVGTGTAGDAGAITFNASGDIITGVDTNISGVTLYGVDARALSGGSGGAISITSQNGSVDTSAGTVNSSSVAGTGGEISLSAANDSAIATIATTNNNVNVDAPLNLTNDTSIDIDGTGGNVNFNDTVDGNQNLTVNSGSGDSNFNAPVGNSQPLGNLQVNSTGTTRFNDTVQSASLRTDTGGETQINGDVTTTETNGQNYGDNVRIDDNLTLNSNNNPITFNGTLNSQTGENNDLTVNAGTENITVNSPVGNTQPLGNLEFNTTGNTQINSTVQSTSLTTDTGGETQINGNVTTTGLNGQNYNDNVRIDNNLTLDSNNNPITVEGTINSQSGETNSLTINSGNSNTSFNADVGNTSSLGDVNINSTNDINTQNLTANTINLTSENNVNTGNLNTSSTTENGGDISLEGTNVTTGNLDSSGINGGNISIEATTSIETGTINSSGASGNGGDVTLDPENDVEVSSINAQGGENGVGGDVDITTEQNLRVTGTFTDQNGTNASISTAGGEDGGSVTIRHGGGSQNTPFVVGDATTNGTAAAITTGTDNTIAPVQSFPGSYTQGTPPNDIQIITEDQPISEPPPQETSPNPLNPLAEQQSVETIENIQNELRKIEEATGAKPAIIYVSFVPKELSNEIREEQLGLNQEAEYQDKLESQVSSDILFKQPDDDDILELILVTSDGKPIRKVVSGTRGDEVQEKAKDFYDEVKGAPPPINDVPNRDSKLFELAHQFYDWLITPLENDLSEKKVTNLVFVMDINLRQLPLAALCREQQNCKETYIVEKYSVGLMPSMSLTDTRYVDIRETQVIARGAKEFDDNNQRSLLTVPEQIQQIEKIWKNGGDFSQNDEDLTKDNLQLKRSRIPFGILHLGTHAEFNVDSPDNSYIQFSGSERLRLNEIRQLGFNKPSLELLVLSACKTALGTEERELGFAGFAHLAGVKSVLASLWETNEVANLALSTKFYRQLSDPKVIKAEALRQAQLAMIHNQVSVENAQLSFAPELGENIQNIQLPDELGNIKALELSHPYYWAGWTVVGNPW
ncbi:MAG: CHAT domain-containing protein [Coleofasciculus sp. A1-SPW-01]|uniref:CHAT domain-containing protein n=1 Tax=Coleofasciculus sp. A1-SPW-01 TaxID=3070819 RepID=UPI003302FC5F